MWIFQNRFPPSTSACFSSVAYNPIGIEASSRCPGGGVSFLLPPPLLFLPQNDKHGIEYTGPRNKPALLEFIIYQHRARGPPDAFVAEPPGGGGCLAAKGEGWGRTKEGGLRGGFHSFSSGQGSPPHWWRGGDPFFHPKLWCLFCIKRPFFFVLAHSVVINNIFFWPLIPLHSIERGDSVLNFLLPKPSSWLGAGHQPFPRDPLPSSVSICLFFPP